MKGLFKILMKEKGEEDAGGGEGEKEPEAAPEPTAEQKELASLKEEMAALRASHAQPAPAPQQITSAQMENYSAEQWAVIEERTGKSRDTILRDYKDYEITTRQNALDAKTNTTEALSDAIEANPKLIKLRGSIKEYMDDVPLADKLDAAKLKRHMDKAITYAKGKHMTNIPDSPTPRRAAGDTPSPKGGEEEDDGGEEQVEGEVKNDEYVSDTGLRIKTGKVNKEVWKQIRHKTKDPNSVSIPADFDKPPSFR